MLYIEAGVFAITKLTQNHVPYEAIKSKIIYNCSSKEPTFYYTLYFLLCFYTI